VFATPIVQGGLFGFEPAPVPARARDQAGIKATLAACELPVEDLTPAALRHFWVMRDGPKLVGVVGLGLLGDVGLLRSLAVLESYRGRGMGAQLADKAEDYARAQGVQTLYLLTTTVPDFFARRGYRRTHRDTAPAPLQNTAEFKSLCPESAVCMMKDI
jgi:amino-acid N-acetyltransferase